jgi:hypothetical protein
MNLTTGYNLGCAFYGGTADAYKAGVPSQTIYNCNSSNYQTCTNDFKALGVCTTGMLTDGQLMAQTYSNGDCEALVNADASESPKRSASVVPIHSSCSVSDHARLPGPCEAPPAARQATGCPAWGRWLADGSEGAARGRRRLPAWWLGIRALKCPLRAASLASCARPTARRAQRRHGQVRRQLGRSLPLLRRAQPTDRGGRDLQDRRDPAGQLLCQPLRPGQRAAAARPHLRRGVARGGGLPGRWALVAGA